MLERVATPCAVAAAITTRSAHATSSAIGAKAPFTAAILRGWVQSLAPKPGWRERRVSAPIAAASSIAVLTPSTGAARQAPRSEDELRFSPMRPVAVPCPAPSGALGFGHWRPNLSHVEVGIAHRLRPTSRCGSNGGLVCSLSL
jgi:hypothetical protein